MQSTPNPQIDHKPAKFSVVSQDDYSITVFAMCQCGDDDCTWTGSIGVKGLFNYNHKTQTEVIKGK